MIEWEEEKELMRELVLRLEVAPGPDRQIDLDIAYLRGWIPQRAIAGEPEPRMKDGSPVPCLTADEAAAEAQLRKSLPGWAIEKVTEPEIDVQAWSGDWSDPDDDYFGDEMFTSAWRRRDGSTRMESPPANMAIALTLVDMRGLAETLA